MKSKFLRVSGVFLFVGVLVMIMPSCKSSKNVGKAVSEGMQEIIVPLSGKEYQSTKELFRAKSVGKSPDIATAKKIALTNAKAELAGLITTTIKSVTHNYTNQRSVADAQDFENKFENLTKEIVAQQLNNVSIIGEKVFKDKAGTVEYWLAVEMSTGAIIAGLEGRISQDKKLQIDYDKKKFEEATKAEFEKMEAGN
jgi:hypothetical protein